MKTILFKTIIIAFFVGTAVSCSDEDENSVLPGHHAHLERVHHGAAVFLGHLL